MKKCCLLFFAILLISINIGFSQNSDYGIWTNASINKDFGKLSFSGETEFRTINNSSDINRVSFQFETSYQIIKPLKIGASYEYILFHDLKYLDYQPRNRVSFFLQGKQKFGKLTFTLRERMQYTTKDESDRIKASGKIDTYKVNPEWTWRNKLKVSYDIPKFPVTPSFSAETFYSLNNPDGNAFENLRFTLSFNYKLTKHHVFEVYGLYDKEINVKSPVNTFVTGVGYVYSF